jgi:putative transcriptional regulator
MGEKRDKYGMTAEDYRRYGVTAEDYRRRLEAMTDEEIAAAALADPDNPPLTDEELARFRPRSLAFDVGRKLHMGRATFARTYGIPLETLTAWERFKLEPTEVELAYLRLIEREPEASKARTRKKSAARRSSAHHVSPTGTPG